MDLDKIKAFNEEQDRKRQESESVELAKENAKSVADTVRTSSLLGAKASSEVKKAVKDSGDKLVNEVEKVQTVLQSGQDAVAQAINNLMLATVLTKDPKLAEAAENVAKLLSSIADAGDKFGKSNLNLLPVANKELAKTITELAKSVRERQDKDLTPEFDRVVEALNNLDIQPIVNLPKSEIKVDTRPITDAIKELQKSIKPTKIDIPKVDFKDVIKGLNDVQSTISNLSFPVPNYVLPFSQNGKATQVVLDADGKVPVAGSFSVDTSALATSANQTNGTQKIQIVDAGGDAVTVTGSKLDVNASVDTTGLATSAKQDTGNTSLGTIAGAVSGTEMQVDVLTMPSVAVTNAGLTELAAAINSNLVDVNIVSGAGSGGTAAADDADFTAGTTQGTPAMGVYESTPTSVTDGDLGTVGITQGRRLKTSATIDSALPAGTNAIGKLSANSGVDIGDVDVTSSALPTGASTSANQTTIIGHLDGVEASLTTIAGDTTDIEAAVELIDDTVATLGTDTYTEASSKGLVVGAVRRDADTTLVDTTNEVAPLQVDANGRLKVEAFSGETLPVSLASTTVTGTVAVTQSGTWDEVGINDSGNSITVDNGGTFAVQDAAAEASLSVMDDWDNAASDGASVSGDTAHDTGDAGEPVKVGNKAVATLAGATLVAANDRTNAYADLDGVPITRSQFPLGDLLSDATSNTDGASTASAIFTAVASTKNYITGFQIFRTDSGTTPIYIDFRDGTGGSVLWRAVLPPNGGSNSPSSSSPLFKTSANTALAYDVSAATTTVYINVSGFQSKL